MITRGSERVNNSSCSARPFKLPLHSRHTFPCCSAGSIGKALTLPRSNFRWEQEKARRKARLATDASATDATANDVDTTSSINTETVTTKDTDQSVDADEDTSRPHGKLVKAESVEDVDQKDLDTEKHELEGEDDSLLEPEEVTFAREEISTLITEEKRMSEVKVDLQSKLQQTRQEVEHLEELLPKRISSGENREILGLLCKVHELEITNAELQSQSLLRENLLRHKDLEMYKYETRQRLCDEIIQLQRKVMEGKITQGSRAVNSGRAVATLTSGARVFQTLTLLLPSSKSYVLPTFINEKCISDVVGSGSIVIFHRSKR